MSAKVTEEEIAKRANVSLEKLDQEYSDDDIREGLAELCDQWRLTGKYLKLEEHQLSAIDENNKKVEEKRIAVLQVKRDQDLDATYLVLVRAFLAMKQAKKALKVCEIFKRSHESSQVDLRSPHPPTASIPGNKRKDAPGSDTSDGNTDSADPSPPATKKRKTNSTQAKEDTVETHAHSVTFDISMSDKDFLKWLKSKGMNQKDSKALSEYGVTAAGFLQFDVKDFDDIALSPFGKKLISKIFNELKGQSDQPSSHTHTQGRDEQTINDETPLCDGDHKLIYTKLKSHAASWREIGSGLGFKEGEMNSIQSRPMLIAQAPESYLREMLSQWLQWAPEDGRGSTGFATKESLRAALLSVDLGQLAQQFK